MGLPKNVFWIFLVLVALAVLLPFILGKFMMGTEKVGFPLRFYNHTSAPPPFSSTTFSPAALLVDVLVCFAGAVVVALLWELLKKSIR